LLAGPLLAASLYIYSMQWCEHVARISLLGAAGPERGTMIV
jgi:hypothetical protein